MSIETKDQKKESKNDKTRKWGERKRKKELEIRGGQKKKTERAENKGSRKRDNREKYQELFSLLSLPRIQFSLTG